MKDVLITMAVLVVGAILLLAFTPLGLLILGGAVVVWMLRTDRKNNYNLVKRQDDDQT